MEWANFIEFIRSSHLQYIIYVAPHSLPVSMFGNVERNQADEFIIISTVGFIIDDLVARSNACVF